MGRLRIVPLILGILLLSVFLAAAFAPDLFTSYGRKDSFGAWEKPSGAHPLGTNDLGYDIFTELVYGTRDTLVIGLVSSALTMLLGTLIGIAAAREGFFGGLFSGIINVFVLLPRLVTLIVLAAFVGSGRIELILLIAAFSWVGTARAVQAEVRHLEAQPFIEACRVYGFSKQHIAFRHILPNLSDILLSRFLIGVNGCIMMESTLSFLGFGDLYHPTWGTMINFAYRRGAFLRQAYPYLLMPGVCVMLLSLAFYLISLYITSNRETVRE